VSAGRVFPRSRSLLESTDTPEFSVLGCLIRTLGSKANLLAVILGQDLPQMMQSKLPCVLKVRDVMRNRVN
jgi:hypothetical protein